MTLYAFLLSFALSLQLHCQEDPYAKSIADAQRQRFIRQDAIFQGLTVINPSNTRTITVDNGAVSTKTIQAVNVITLTNFTSPFQNATHLERFVVDTQGQFRQNLFVTVEGDEKRYFQEKGIPITNNTETTFRAQESVGISHINGYQVLSIWVDPTFVTRPSFNPDITSNAPPVWNEALGRYDFTNVNPATLPAFFGMAPVAKDASGKFVRPFATFPGYQEYENWFNAWSTASYDVNGGRAFPFTGLGWTWNWNPDPTLNGFALSEFIVNGNGEYYFQGLRPTLGYFFPIIGRTPNETSVGNALDSVYDTASGDLKTTINDIVALDDGPTIAATFGEISPARANSLTRQTVLGIQEVTDIISDRFTCPAEARATDKGATIWADFKYMWTNSDSEPDHFGFDATAPVIIIGGEKRTAQSLYGLAFSFAHHELTWSESGGDANANVPFLTGYAGKKIGRWIVGAELGGGWISNNTHLNIANLGQELNGDYSATGILVGLRGTRPFTRGRWTLNPFIGLQYLRLWEDSYTETGSATALNVNSRAIDMLRSDIGICAKYGFLTKDKRVMAQSIKFRWLAPLTGNKDSITGSLVGNPGTLVTGTDYVAPGSTIAVGIATSYELARNRTIQLSYDFWDELDGPFTKQEIDLQYVVGF